MYSWTWGARQCLALWSTPRWQWVSREVLSGCCRSNSWHQDPGHGYKYTCWALVCNKNLPDDRPKALLFSGAKVPVTSHFHLLFTSKSFAAVWIDWWRKPSLRSAVRTYAPQWFLNDRNSSSMAETCRAVTSLVPSATFIHARPHLLQRIHKMLKPPEPLHLDPLLQYWWVLDQAVHKIHLSS